jgi:PAS domain S-box-containing protein
MVSISSLRYTRPKGSIIAARKRAENALRSSEAKLAGILAIAGDAIVSIDAGYRINLFNEAAERLFGYSPTEVLGRPIDVLIPTRFHAAHQQHIDTLRVGSRCRTPHGRAAGSGRTAQER